MIEVELQELIDSHEQYGQSICEKLVAEINKLGFDRLAVENRPDYSSAHFEVAKDPYTGDKNLLANWYNEQKQRVGHIQFQSNGGFYAEYDVVKNHPSKPKWFVEAITAWGKDKAIKCEAKLLLLP